MYDTMTQIEMGTGLRRRNRIVETPDTGLVVQDRPCGRAYKTADPERIADAFQRAGFLTTLIRPMSRRHKRPSVWRQVVKIETAASGLRLQGVEYTQGASILLTHDGRTSIQIVPFALRVECENQFLAPAVCIPHYGEECDRFLEDPVGVTWEALRGTVRVRERLEALRGIGNEETLLGRVRTTRPRLASAALRQAEFRGYKSDFWGVLQAFTATRQATLLRLTGLGLDEGFAELLQGKAPECWERLLRPRAGAPEAQ